MYQTKADDEVKWEFASLWRLVVFLQPLKQLSHYNRLKKHDVMMRNGRVNHDMLPPLQESQFQAFDDRIDIHIDNLWSRWVLRTGDQSLLRIVWSNNRTQLLYYIFVVQLCVLSKMTVSYLLGRTLHLISLYQSGQEGITFYDITALSTSLSVMLVVVVLLEQHFQQNIYQVSVKIRFQITGLLLRKLNSIKSDAKIFNLISMDANDIDAGLTGFLALSGSPLVGTLGILLMLNYFGVSALVGIMVLVCVNLVQRKTIDMTSAIRVARSVAQDARTQLTSDFLHNIRTLKMFASEQIYRDMLVQRRSEQDKHSRKLLLFDTLSMCLTGNLSVFVALLATIVCYVRVQGGVLSVDKIFGTLWVLQLMKVWCLSYFYRGRKFWVSMKVLNERLMSVLLTEDVVDDMREDVIQVNKQKRTKKGNIAIVDEETGMKEESPPERPRILFTDFHGRWSKLQDAYNLRNINLRCELPRDGTGQLICVVGKIGSHKTTLLRAILRELPHQQGFLDVQGSMAYVEQTPYIFSGTVRSNILFGRAYCDVTYKRCLQESCLDADLLTRSDLSEVGDKGARLSGGQRARVSFARALYSDASMVLIDDVLSAVDARVAQQIFARGIMGLRSRGKLVLLVTHQTQWAALSDRVLQMEGGAIVQEAVGASAINSLLSRINDDDVHDVKKSSEDDVVDTAPQQHEEQIHTPDINVYARYLQEAGGYGVLVLIMLCYLVDASLNLIITKSFGIWAADQPQQSQDAFYHQLTQMTIMIVLFWCSSFTKVNLLFNRTLTATSNMHRKLSSSIARAQVSYFDTTPIGSILARFTNDLNNIESMVMIDSHWVLEGCFDNIFVIIVVSSQNFAIVLASVTLLMLMFTAKQSFAKFMEYSIKCDDLSRAQLFNHIESSIQGSSLVRAYRQQEHFYQDFLALVYKNMQGYFSFLRLNALIAFIFECSLQILIIFALQIMILFEVAKSEKSGSADDVGFSLLMLLNLGYMFSLNLRGQIYLDIDLQNAQRVFKSIDNPCEGQFEYDNDYQIQLSKWPQCGVVEFKNVSLNYTRSTMGQKSISYALKNVSFSIQAGESIGIVGRTGAGKSSLFNALLRLTDVDSGSILIDGLDIDTIGIHTLRESLLVLPQHAPIMCVSMRINIDPKNQYQDSEIWNSLEQVGLAEKIRSLPLQLHTIAAQDVFSAGEKQLFCLSRLLLNHNPKIILFDEATSNMDYETDEKVQLILRQKFPYATKIMIAHRLQTVMDCDRILVLEKGEVREYDKPYLLMTDSRYHVFKQMFDSLDEDRKRKILQQLENKV